MSSNEPYVNCPLKNILLQTDKQAKLLDASLREALNLARSYATSKPSSSAQPLVHESLLANTELALRLCASSHWEFKVIVLFTWIVQVPDVRAFFSRGLTPRSYDGWFMQMCSEFDNYVLGLQKTGEKYARDNNKCLQMATFGPFVHSVVSFFCAWVE